MESFDEVYVVTDGKSFYDVDGLMYSLSIDTLSKIGFSEQYAKKVYKDLNESAYPGMLTVSKLELFAKIN